VAPGPDAQLKRRALECHRSQTTRYFDWQTRPILTAELVDRVCAEPETFLVQEPALEGRRVLARGRAWVPIAHRPSQCSALEGSLRGMDGRMSLPLDRSIRIVFFGGLTCSRVRSASRPCSTRTRTWTSSSDSAKGRARASSIGCVISGDVAG